MNWVTVVWSAASGACLMLALMHLVVWLRDRRSWANLCFCVMALGTIGMAAAEMGMMHAKSPEAFGRAGSWAHLVHVATVAGSVGFVHFYFGTSRVWLLALVVGLRGLAAVANLTTGVNLHLKTIHSLETMTLLGEKVTVLGEWTLNPWVVLGQIAALVQLIYLVDASVRLWRKGTGEAHKRAVLVGGLLSLYVIVVAGLPGLIAAGVLKMPVVISFPFLGILLVMGYELSRDVLRAARLARDLHESEQRMTLAAESANLGIWIRDLERREVWATAQWRALFGFTKSERLDLDEILLRLHPEDREVLRKSLAGALEGDGHYATEYRVLPPDGRIRWIASSGRVELNEAGKPALVRGVSLDITERKVAEQEAMRHRQELAHLSRVSILGELAGAIAHELNQPLAAMLSNAQVGRRGLGAGEPDLVEMAAIFDDITADAKRAGGIIHGMRAMFKKDATHEMQAIDLNEAIRQVAAMLHGETTSRKVRLELQLDEALPVVMADRVGIQQVVMNLILNSLDALANNAEPGRIEISTEMRNERAVVWVRDNGPGIDADLRARLFEPFASTKAGGLGLGLAISRSIAERHGGQLTAGNAPEGGAVFLLTLPVADGAK